MPGEHDRRRALRVALEVDEDVDGVAADLVGDRERIAVAHVGEAVERPHEPRAHRRAVVRSRRVAEHVETRTIVPLEQSRREVGRRVRVEVGRQVADAQPPRRQHAPARQRLDPGQAGRPRLRALALFRPRRRQREERERRQERLFVRNTREKLLDQRAAVAPVGDPRGQKRELRQRRAVRGIDAQYVPVGVGGSRQVGELEFEHVAQLVPQRRRHRAPRERGLQRPARLLRRADAGLDHRLVAGIAFLVRREACRARHRVERLEHPPLRLQRKREDEPRLGEGAVARGQFARKRFGFRVAAPGGQAACEIAEDLGGIRRDLRGLREDFDRGAPVSDRLQHEAQVGPRVGVAVVDRHRRTQPVERLREPARLVERHAGVVERGRMARLAREDRVVPRERFRQLALLVKRVRP